MNWNVESYQLVFFHQPSVVQDAFQVWIQLFQLTPDNYQRHPDPNAKSAQAAGNFAGYLWQVATSPGRIDVSIVGNASDVVDQMPGFPIIKNDGQALDLLITKSRLLQPELLGVVRLALVSQFSQNVADLAIANEMLLELVPVSNFPQGALDIIFSLNVRKHLNDPVVHLNRLCRWQAIEKQLFQIQMGVSQMMQPAFSQPAVTLNVDINTVQQQSAIKAQDVDRVIRNLVNETLAIRARGYDGLTS